MDSLLIGWLKRLLINITFNIMTASDLQAIIMFAELNGLSDRPFLEVFEMFKLMSNLL